MTRPTRNEVDRAIASIMGKPMPAEVDRETEEVAKLLQGCLAGILMREMATTTKFGPVSLPIQLRNVDIPTDADGNYLDHFIVVTASGRRIKVEVTPEP